MMLITGATGQYGSATIDFLLKKGIAANEIVALVRDKSKAESLIQKGIEIRVGDYNDYESLTKAFQGVEKLLLISSSDLANRSQQHENAVRAAKEAGVRHIVYTSFERKNETETSPIALVAQSHIHTEKKLKEIGMAYTILRNNLYMDFLPMFFGDTVLQTGIFLPAGEGKAAFTLRQDMAEATANILSSEGHINKEYTFSSPENLSLQDLADTLGQLTGKNIAYISPSAEIYAETLTKAGVPAEYVGVFAGFATAINQGELERYNSDLETLLGRKPTTAKEFLSQIYTPALSKN